jgi:hypothetical protein
MGGSDAQAGFYYQNIVAAWHILGLIEIGSSIESISLENPERAKFIDDIIVDASDRKSFIQVKWSEDDATAITLHSLVTPEESSAIPLIAKLAAGFRKIRNESGKSTLEFCYKAFTTYRHEPFGSAAHFWLHRSLNFVLQSF